MVGTYRYDGEEVTREEFKKLTNTVTQRNEPEIKEPASKSSKTPLSISRDTGLIVRTEIEDLKPDIKVIAIGKDEDGRTTVQNVGKTLTPTQRATISNLSDQSDSRLKTSVDDKEVTFFSSQKVQTQAAPPPSKWESISDQTGSGRIISKVKSIDDTPTQQFSITPITNLNSSIGFAFTPNQKISERTKPPEPIPSFVQENSLSSGFISRGKIVFDLGQKEFSKAATSLNKGDVGGAVTSSIIGTGRMIEGGFLGVSSPFIRIGEGLSGFGKEAVQSGLLTATTNTFGRLFTGVTALIDPNKRPAIIGSVKQSAVSDPIGFTARTFAEVASPNLIRTTAIKGRNLYVSTGSKYVPQEKLFTTSNLEGGGYELVSSAEESLAAFRTTERSQRVGASERIVISNIDDGSLLPSGTYVYSPHYAGRVVPVSSYDRFYGPIVQTSGDSRLKGLTAGEGGKAAAKLEDPGIYVSPLGRGSTEFLGITKGSTAYSDVSFSLNPFAGLGGTPTVTTFRTKGVSRLPRRVTDQAGFEGVRDFFTTEGAATGKVFITKRSEIGTGDVPRQWFVAQADTATPFWGGVTVKRDGQIFKTRQVKKGDMIREPSTTELEGVIPLGSTFAPQTKGFVGVFKGFNEFTTINNVNVPIRRAKLITGKTSNSVSLGKGFSDSKIISGERVAREGSSVSSVGSRSVSVSPFVSVSSFSGSSSVSSSSVFSTSFSSSPSPSSSSVSGASSISSSSVFSTSFSSSPSPSSSSVSGASSISFSGSSFTGGGSSVTSGGSSFTGGGSSVTGGGSSVTSGGSSFTGEGSSFTGEGSSFTGGGSSVTEQIFFKPDLGFKEKKKKKRFGVSVLQKGEFKFLGFTSTKEEAFFKGSRAVESNTDRTFKVTTVGGTPITGFSNSRFRMSKSRKGSFVEKSKFAINTGGEVTGLKIGKIKQRGIF